MPPRKTKLKIQAPRRNGFLIWDVPEELKAKFKAKCASQGRTMREVTMDFLEGYSK